MAYYDIALLTLDVDYQMRVSAAYSVETLGDPDVINPNGWTNEHIWEMASAPGFGDAYASAIAGAVPNPGRDPSVISDEMILSAIQAVMAMDPTTPGPPER